MCTVCGCGTGETKIEGADAKKHDHAHDHDHGHSHGHSHGHDHSPEHHEHHHHHGEDGSLHYGKGPAGVHVAGQSQARLIEIETDILAKNDALAAVNRRRFAEAGVIALNMMSSPGSGKTTLLVETLKTLSHRYKLAVIEGDQQTTNDARRIRETGVPAIQVNTGKGCHLDADMVGHAVDHLGMPEGGVLFIENVGNLVCPASFDLGETRRVVLASVTEGEDKPLKYPEMFATADLVIISKMDLQPHLEFDVDELVANARKVNPRVDVVYTSAKGEPGLGDWIRWLEGLSLQHKRPSAAE